MQDLTFIQKHSLQEYTESEKETDYSEKDSHYIRCLQAMEETMDTDAYILDYRNEQILYMSRHCSLRKAFRNGAEMNGPYSYQLLDQIILREDLEKVEIVNRLGYDFYFALPLERRYRGSSVIDIRIRSANGNYILMNHKMSPLDITEDGRIRLGLCVLTSPASKTPVTSYLKMSDDHTVYEYMEKSKKFVQVKVQRLTPKSEKVLELAGCGKTEKEIADTLGISLNTVKYHKRMILRQLNVRNTTEAVQWINSQKTLADTI